MLDDPAHRLAILDDCLESPLRRWPFITIIQGLAAPIAGMFRRRLPIDQQRSLEGPELLAEAYLKPNGQGSLKPFKPPSPSYSNPSPCSAPSTATKNSGNPARPI